MSDNAQRKRIVGKPFQAGNSGKPKGTRHRATLAVEALLAGEAEGLTRRAIVRAMEGDTTALRLCLERIAPVRKGRILSLDLGGPVRTPADLARASCVILDAIAAGEMTTDEAADFSAVLERVGAAIERRDLELRIAALESKR